jgi:cytochrome c oxidase subunit 2
MKASYLILLFLLSCSKNPSILLDPAGPQAKKISELFWFIFSFQGAVFLIVLGFLFYAIWRRKEKFITEPFEPSKKTEKRLALAVSISIGLTVIILTSFVSFTYLVDKDLIKMDEKADLEIEITAHQWWWEIKYLDPTPSKIFTTANEIHVPVNKKVKFKLKSVDVIHSFWIPNLAGKQDIIPGREREIVIRAEKKGTWRGRCGEYCGLQHAKMGLTLFAEANEDFEKWKKAQRLPAAPPTTALEKEGEKIFKTSSCILCHVIRSPDSGGHSNIAPDLTHLKSRTTIGAGAAKNTKGHLGGWIINPHGLKPGVHMPTIIREPDQHEALLHYLETLK